MSQLNGVELPVSTDEPASVHDVFEVPDPRVGNSKLHGKPLDDNGGAKLLTVSAFASQFKMFDRVHIDGDQSIKAVVTGFQFMRDGTYLQCEWFANGSPQKLWTEVERASSAE